MAPNKDVPFNYRNLAQLMSPNLNTYTTPDAKFPLQNHNEQ